MYKILVILFIIRLHVRINVFIIMRSNSKDISQIKEMLTINILVNTKIYELIECLIHN